MLGCGVELCNLLSSIVRSVPTGSNVAGRLCVGCLLCWPASHFGDVNVEKLGEV